MAKNPIKKYQSICVRIAPSPTGTLHIGTARTALFNYLFARQKGGRFFLRIEDTDIERSKPEFEKDITENLRWLGLDWDGEIVKQSQRTEIYQKYLKKLLDSGDAFWCYHTKEELEKEKKEKESRGEAQVHFCDHKKLKVQNSKFKATTQNQKTNGVIRLKCPRDQKIKFHDLIRGNIEFDTSQIGDMVIAKDEKTPLYNFAVVIDDSEMNITHVIRGEDHISNTPKQILIYQALGLSLPKYAHIPLTLAPDRSKLSKRHGAVAIEEYKKLGYLPEALNNFMAFLGWNPGGEKEIFSLEELVKEFSLKKMQKSNAVFNLEKLDWLNGYYIRQMPIGELATKCIPYLEDRRFIKRIFNFQFSIFKKNISPKFQIIETEETVDLEWLKKIVALEQERMKKLSEIGESADFFFKDKLDYGIELLRWKKMTPEEIKTSLDKSYNLLSKLKESDFEAENLESVLMPEAEAMGDRGTLLWPLRAALSGKKASPGPFDILAILGQKRALKRLKEAVEKIKKA